MSRTLRFAIAALALTLAQTSAAAVAQRPSAEKKRQQAASDAACPDKVAGSFTKRPAQATNTVIAKLMTGAGDAALVPKGKQAGVAR